MRIEDGMQGKEGGCTRSYLLCSFVFNIKSSMVCVNYLLTKYQTTMHMGVKGIFFQKPLDGGKRCLRLDLYVT